MGALRPYLELIRLPAVFTAPADVLAGVALATCFGAVVGWGTVGLLVLSSACVYCAGMAANDVFDAKIDAAERPGRPIPSGRVSLGQAWALVLGLQVAGLGVAALVSTRALLAVALTIAATYLYNATLKDTAVGTWSMGLCRYANACIGLSLASDLPWVAWAAPVGTLLYVVAVTTVSRHEVDGATRAEVAGPLYVLWFLPLLAGIWAPAGLLPDLTGAALVVVPLVWLAGPVRRALANPGAGSVRGAVMAGIFGIAMVNATLAASAGAWTLAAIILGLLVPGRFVGRWFYAT